MSATISTPSDSDVIACTSDVWSMMLGMDLEVSGSSPPLSGSTLTATVMISGAWSGAVVIQCEEQTARNTGAAMFCSEPQDTSTSDIMDAMGELANMVGGSLKDRVGPNHGISIPTVTSGHDYTVHMGHATEIGSVRFLSPEGPIDVRVFQAS